MTTLKERNMKTLFAAALLTLLSLSACTAISAKDPQPNSMQSPADCYPGAAPECRGLTSG